MKHALLTFLTVASFVVAPNAYADEQAINLAKVDVFDTTPYENDIKRITDYLSSFKTLKSRFSEIATHDGTVNQGTIFVSRPGKLKVDYRSPDSIMIVMNGEDIMYYDRDNDTVSYGKVPGNPLDILLYENVSFTEGVRITNINRTPNDISITVAPLIPEDKKQIFSEFASLTLSFSTSPLTLRRIRKTDINNHSSTFTFIRPKFDISLADNDFPFHNPRGSRLRQKN